MSIDSVKIGFEPMPVERFKEAFYDPCPKERIPELLNCLSYENRREFEAWLKEEADAMNSNGLTPLEYDPIPCNATALVFFENEQTDTWGAEVDSAGILRCLIDPQGNKYHSEEELHDRHVSHYTLEFEHTVAVAGGAA